MKIIEGNKYVLGKKFVIVIFCFNDFIGSSLLVGVVDEFKCIGGVFDDDIIVVYVLGVVELFLVVKCVVVKKEYDVIIVLGVVIRGGILYFDLVVGELNKGFV